jgi:hypothetical protein
MAAVARRLALLCLSFPLLQWNHVVKGFALPNLSLFQQSERMRSMRMSMRGAKNDAEESGIPQLPASTSFDSSAPSKTMSSSSEHISSDAAFVGKKFKLQVNGASKV